MTHTITRSNKFITQLRSYVGRDLLDDVISLGFIYWILF